MKRMNVMFTGIASLISLSVLVNCSDRFGGMRSAKEIRGMTCDKYNAWARKAGKPELCKPVAGGGLAKVNGKGQNPPLQEPRAEDRQQPPRAEDGKKQPPRGEVQPLPRAEDGKETPPRDGGQQPPRGDDQQPPQGEQRPGLSREAFTQDYNSGSSGEWTKIIVKGLNINLARGKNALGVEVLAVANLQNEQGRDEVRKIVVKDSVTPFSNASVPAIESISITKKGDETAEPVNDRVRAFASCLSQSCDKVGVMLAFKRQNAQMKDGFGFAITSCEVEVATGKKNCGVELATYEDAFMKIDQADVPPAQGDVSGAPGDVSGAPGDVSGGQPPVADQPSTTNSELMKYVREQVLPNLREKLLAVNAALEAAGKAKQAGNAEEAKAELAKADAAAKEAKAALDLINTAVEDLNQQPDATEQDKKDLAEIAADAKQKVEAAETAVTQWKASLTPSTAAPAPGDISGAPGDVSGGLVPGETEGTVHAPADEFY